MKATSVRYQQELWGMEAAQVKESLLRDSGAVLIGQGHHMKYKLPNGEIYVEPKTGSDWRGHLNGLQILRTKLKSTHPELVANSYPGAKSAIDRSISRHEKRHKTSNPKLIGFHQRSTVSQVPLLPEPLPMCSTQFRMTAALPEYIPAEEQPLHHAPRHRPLENKPRPGAVFSLTQEEIATHNMLSLTRGQSAADRFFAQCREAHYSMSAQTTHNGAFTMSDDTLVDRAKTQLRAINASIETFAERKHRFIESQKVALEAFEAEHTAELAAQKKLRTFAERHKALLDEMSDIQGLLKTPTAKSPKTPSTRGPYKGGSKFTREQLAEVVSGLNAKGLKEFRAVDIVDLAKEKGFNADKQKLSVMLAGLHLEGKIIERMSKGAYQARS